MSEGAERPQKEIIKKKVVDKRKCDWLLLLLYGRYIKRNEKGKSIVSGHRLLDLLAIRSFCFFFIIIALFFSASLSLTEGKDHVVAYAKLTNHYITGRRREPYKCGRQLLNCVAGHGKRNLRPFFSLFPFWMLTKRDCGWWLNGDGWREAGHVMETGKKRSDVLKSPSRPIG